MHHQRFRLRLCLPPSGLSFQLLCLFSVLLLKPRFPGQSSCWPVLPCIWSMGSRGTMVLWALALLHCFWCGKTDNGAPSLAATAATPPEIEALLDLKKGFNNPPQLSSWDAGRQPPTTPPPPCSGWTGVLCDNITFSVVSVILPSCFEGGIIRPSIERLRFLQVLDLSGNAITGSIPVEITRLPRLVSLNLQKNRISGQLPAVWDEMESLEMVNLWQNNLTGTIPAGLFKAGKLQRLRLENNRLSGEVPAEIGGLKNLRFFAASSNLLTGPIPTEVGNVRSLRSVYASSNRFNGTLPESIGGLPKLARLDLHHNDLHGAIPAAWADLTDTLLTLNLSENNLTGEIPNAFSQKFNETSFLSNPGLCGLPIVTRTCFPSSEPLPHSPPLSEGPPTSPGGHNRMSKVLAGVIGASIGGVAVLSLFVLLFVYRRSHAHTREVSQAQNWFSPEIQANIRHGKFELYDEGLVRHSFQDIESNAGFFDTAHVAGRGRFATVYRSHFPDGVDLALKMFKYPIATAAFDKEIPILAAIKHKHLLSIKGYYSTSVEKALIYEYYPRGTLHRLLHGYDESSPFIHATPVNPTTLPDWATRQRIAFGVAQALDYLHRGCNTRVLHMDVKSSNILLETSSLLPMLADYGLLHLVSENAPDSADGVVETEGYTAPEVMATRKYTDKSDIYSFGVVLLELITGQRSMCQVGDRRLALTSWAAELHEEGHGREIMDAIALKTSPFPEYLDRALNLAMMCVNENPGVRPPMSEVASILEGLASNPSPLKSPDQRMMKPLLIERQAKT